MPVIGLLYLFLALFDAWFTAKRIPLLGIGAEYNHLIRWLYKTLGVKTGIYTGVLIPTAGVFILAYFWPCVLVYLFGCRTTLFAFQMKVLFTHDDPRTIKPY